MTPTAMTPSARLPVGYATPMNGMPAGYVASGTPTNAMPSVSFVDFGGGTPTNGATMPVAPRRNSNPFGMSMASGEVSPQAAPQMRPARARCHTVMNMNFADPTDSLGLGMAGMTSPTNAPPAPPANNEALRAHRRTHRSKTMGDMPSSHVTVSVVAPGGGTGINASVYQALGRKEDFTVNITGQSRAQYDRYPVAWGGDGAPAPNLESFAMDLAAQGILDSTDCLVVGSRGGQVVLPTLWRVKGDEVPPTVVMNGGCAMGLPIQVPWPDAAVSFLLLGGKDYFHGNMGMAEYLADAKSRVPVANETTAILLVHEMVHMPQADLLNAVLMHMIRAVTSWKSAGRVPIEEFKFILGNVRRGGWTGKLTYKTGPGDAWSTEAFP